MARPRKDKFIETTISFEEGTDFELVNVTVPTCAKITYKVKISEDNNGRPLYATTESILKRTISDEAIKKEFQKKGMEIIKTEDATIKFRNFCEKCQRNGIPSIEKKPNKIDYHYRAKTDTHKTPTKRPDDYWLVYSHKTAPRKCRIMLFDINKFQFKSSKNKVREIYKYIFPQCIEWAKKESTFLSSFQKFANAVYP